MYKTPSKFATLLRRLQRRKQGLRQKKNVSTVGAPVADLPSELWILIIRFATLSHPDPIDTTHAVSFLDPPHSMQLRLAAYNSTMRQKRTMCLVNHQWHAWSLEFMYEYVWVSRASHAALLARTLSSHSSKAYGNWIRRLHVETAMSLDKCNPAHLRTILDEAPSLAIYSDHRSIRLTVVSVNTPLQDVCTPDDLFQSLPSNLRRLSWTSYEFSPTPHMPSFSVLEKLTFLELNFHTSALSSHFFSSSTIGSIFPQQPLSLPHLQTLKTSLCSNTFSLLAAWHLPKLRNLSLMSLDFSYSSPSFIEFLQAHGPHLVQLELGHSSSSILEEHYLTPQTAVIMRPNLAALLPNLQEFICSANAEWNWESPDWIAPHVFLPAHPTLKLIGIRDIGRGGDFVLLEQMRSLLRREAYPCLRYVRDMGKGLGGVRKEVEKDSVTVEFWRTVWQGCRGREVYLEDWEGVNVTASDWRRLGFKV